MGVKVGLLGVLCDLTCQGCITCPQKSHLISFVLVCGGVCRIYQLLLSANGLVMTGDTVIQAFLGGFQMKVCLVLYLYCVQQDSACS